MKKPDEITEQNEKMWNARAQSYQRFFWFTHWDEKKLISLLSLGEDSLLLDLACGPGWALRYAAHQMKGKGEFYGIDLSAEMIKQAEINSAQFKNIHFRKANAEEVPFNNDFFDYVICTNAFYHFANPDRVLKEAKRVLKPHGRIYILNITSDFIVIRWLDRLFRLEPGHVKIYTANEYRTLFQRAELHYQTTKSTILPMMKIHIGEKE
jgi:ubiquinone/menaquinone biosynthesis C-methylase UbiE